MFARFLSCPLYNRTFPDSSAEKVTHFSHSTIVTASAHVPKLKLSSNKGASHPDQRRDRWVAIAEECHRHHKHDDQPLTSRVSLRCGECVKNKPCEIVDGFRGSNSGSLADNAAVFT